MVVGIRRQVVPARTVDWSTRHEPALYRRPDRTHDHAGAALGVRPGRGGGTGHGTTGANLADGIDRRAWSAGPAACVRRQPMARRGPSGAPGLRHQPLRHRSIRPTRLWPCALRPSRLWPCALRPSRLRRHPLRPTRVCGPGGASTNGLAIASLILSIAGLFLFTSVVGIVFGFVARGQIKNSGDGRRGTDWRWPASSSVSPGWRSSSSSSSSARSAPTPTAR